MEEKTKRGSIETKKCGPALDPHPLNNVVLRTTQNYHYFLDVAPYSELHLLGIFFTCFSQ